MYDPTDKLTQENDKRSFYMMEPDGNCFYFPQEWASEFDDDQDGYPELYGYYPMHEQPNSPVDVGYVAVHHLTDAKEVTEQEARESHPALAAYLDAINNEE